MEWTAKRVDTLTELWGEGLSARQIADILTQVTRNAVIGKAHRLGLSTRVTPTKPVISMLNPVTDRACQWPIGDPGDVEFHFCGHASIPNRPYCNDHCLMAYRQAGDTNARTAKMNAAAGKR
jgi:GcrA cell cycle regulator